MQSRQFRAIQLHAYNQPDLLEECIVVRNLDAVRFLPEKEKENY